MPALTNYRLFISHSWTYSDAYEKLVSVFDEYPNFKWTNYSVPKNDPVHNAPTEDKLTDAIRSQLVSVNCVVILAGVYSTYSKWINKEILLATSAFTNPKPIVAIEPWGAEKTSKVVKEQASVVVKWNSHSIVSAIREYSI